MLYASRSGNRSGDVDRSRQRGESRSSVDLFSVVHSVWHTDNQRVCRKQSRELTRGFGGAYGFNAEQNNLAIASSGEFRGCGYFDVFLELNGVEKQAVRFDGVNERLAADKNNRSASACEHAAEVTADRAGANDRNARPRGRRWQSTRVVFNRGHVVTTATRRSMSRSLL